ncbi:hypothetical protein J2S49_001523 [Arcanobacterium wilhelmae]|uniref:Uncharacterized protein n=1 Tax=Arcanobacterium wilhelmae TaxID=1803177 RepID=A0ABT9NCK1_9ACTO|nr:hypothetical protein [Arcanobacterium wilhelmae]
MSDCLCVMGAGGGKTRRPLLAFTECIYSLSRTTESVVSG